MTLTERYNAVEIERKWQARWEADGLYEGDVVLPLEAALQIAPGVQNLSLDRTPVA